MHIAMPAPLSRQAGQGDPAAHRPTSLTPAELPLLRAIHEADRDRGGLSRDELSEDEAATCDELVERGFAEVIAEFGEAPDGEEDERDAGGRGCYRITGRGVEVLADAAGDGGAA